MWASRVMDSERTVFLTDTESIIGFCALGLQTKSCLFARLTDGSTKMKLNQEWNSPALKGWMQNAQEQPCGARTNLPRKLESWMDLACQLHSITRVRITGDHERI